jgi:hypothetical protein
VVRYENLLILGVWTVQTGGRLLSSLYTAMANLLVGRLCWWEGMMCSMYAVWGSRTGEGKLYSGEATSRITTCNFMTS